MKTGARELRAESKEQTEEGGQQTRESRHLPDSSHFLVTVQGTTACGYNFIWSTWSDEWCTVRFLMLQNYCYSVTK
jgi:hypothetical protein